jgi:uncharacterized protein YjbI with pentapeptide repeats
MKCLSLKQTFADLKDAYIAGTDLERASLTGADHTNVDLRNTSLITINKRVKQSSSNNFFENKYI